MENFNTTLTSLEDMSYATGMGNDTMYIFDSEYSSLEDMSYATGMGNDTMYIFDSEYSSLEDMSYATGMGNDNVDNFISAYSSQNTQHIHLKYIRSVINVVTLCIELPVICWAVFALYHQAKAGHVTHVYVINLLISDLIQIIGRLMDLLLNHNVWALAVSALFDFGIGASILFMMCIALERYLLVVHPLWYRFRRTIKHSILISVAVYVCDLLFIIAVCLTGVMAIAQGTFLLLPLPLLVFFLVATWRALSHSISVSHQEKKRMLGTLALVLLIYLVTIFPTMYLHFYEISNDLYANSVLYMKMYVIAYAFLYITPIMDALLYILIKKDASYTLVPHCCRRLCTHTESRETSTVRAENVTSV